MSDTMTSGTTQMGQQPPPIGAPMTSDTATPSATPRSTVFVAPPTSYTEQKIAQAISLGLVSEPTDPEGWRRLVDEYEAQPSTPGAFQALNPLTGDIAVPAPPAVTPKGTPTAAAPPATGNDGLDTFMSVIRTHESNGNYSARNPDSGAYGAYQIMPSNWSSWAVQAGLAPTAPMTAANQDKVAAAQMQSLYNALDHNWGAVAVAWYAGPSAAQAWLKNPNDPRFNAPQGAYPSINQYAQQVNAALAKTAPAPQQTAAVPSGTPGIAVAQAQSQLGVPYQWGGEAAGKDFDCSGLVQWAYGNAGLQLPRTAQEQYDATTKVPAGQALTPGDLVFFGTDANHISHVGIYIGNNQMIDAPHTGAAVRTEDYRWADFIGATRPFDATGLSVAPPQLQQSTLTDYYQTLSRVQRGVQVVTPPQPQPTPQPLPTPAPTVTKGGINGGTQPGREPAVATAPGT